MALEVKLVFESRQDEADWIAYYCELNGFASEDVGERKQFAIDSHLREQNQHIAGRRRSLAERSVQITKPEVRSI